jgi:hypothetical protein
VFCTPISPQRPKTPEAVEAIRKRTLTLVHRTPDKPPAVLVIPTTPSITITSKDRDLYSAPLEPTKIPTSKALARFDERPRQEGNNSEYIRLMGIERGRGRGGRGWRGRGGRS